MAAHGRTGMIASVRRPAGERYLANRDLWPIGILTAVRYACMGKYTDGVYAACCVLPRSSVELVIHECDRTMSERAFISESPTEPTPSRHGQLLFWLRRHGVGLIDLALVVTALLMATTDATVLFFHFIFVWLAIGAFFWRFPAFAIRSSVWVTIATLQVVHAVVAGKTQPEELIEIPLLTIILIVVFVIARRRANARADVERQQVFLAAVLEHTNDGIIAAIPPAQC